MAGSLPFATSHFLSLGVEVEVQLVDLRDGALRPAGPHLLERLPRDGHYKPEFFRSTLEFATGVCTGLNQVEGELRTLGARLGRLARCHGLGLIGCGAHPFAPLAQTADIWPDARYLRLLANEQWLSRICNILGLHVHVGMHDQEQAIELLNGFSAYLGHVLALSANSPYLYGEDTGLASARVTAYESQPIAGPTPALASYAEFEDMVAALQASGSIGSMKDLHWDLRPCPSFGTVEVRICDGQNNLDDTMALVALVQWLFAWLEERRQQGERFAPVPGWRLRENKWRAMRWGLEARMLSDDRGGVSRPLRHELPALLEGLEPIARRLNGPGYLARVQRLIEESGAERQRRRVAAGASLERLVQQLSGEWLHSYSETGTRRVRTLHSPRRSYQISGKP